METVQKLSAEEAKDLEEEVSVPYRVEDVTVLSEGEWNGLQWTASELREAVENTDFSFSQDRGDERPPNSSLYHDHEDRSADQFVGRVDNVRMEGKDVKSDLVITDKQAAVNLEFGAPFGVSPKADGLVDERGTMQDFRFENFSLVVNPAVKTTWLNEDITSVLEDLEIHRPKYRSVGDSEWSSPNLSDFVGHSEWEKLSKSEKTAVGKHFLVSKSGFPADTYSDLALPVVDSSGELNRAALQQAKSRVSQVSGIKEDEITRVENLTDNLANGNFEDADFGGDSIYELQDYEVHEPDFSDTVDQEWNKPNLEDFTDGDSDWEGLSEDVKSEVGGHFIASSTGFPSDSYGDMALPVVEPDGALNLNALANAKARAGQVEGMSDSQVEDVKMMITEMANSNFEDASFEEVENKSSTMVDYEFGSGDKVKWDSRGGMAMGVVRDRTKDSCFNEEIDGDVEVCGEQDAPAYLIEIYDDEEEETTGTMVGHKQETLNKANFELNDITVNKPMAETETQEPDADEASGQEEDSAEDYVTAEELEDFKSEVVNSLKQELGDDEDEEVEDGGDDVEEAEGDTELSEFEEFRQENPDMSLSEAAEEFEESNKDVEEKIDEVTEMFESKISDLEEKLEEKDEEVEELSEKVTNPQRATQVSGGEEDGAKDLREEVSELSDEELHAQVFKQMSSDRGVTATKEMIHND